MEKSDSEPSEKQVSGDEGGNQRDEQPTTSRGENNSPVQNSHNMNDFKSLDFNSADDVRQAMKAVLTGNLPPQSFTEEANQSRVYVQNKSEPVKVRELANKSEPVEVPELANKTHGYDLRKTVQRQVQRNLNLKMKSTAQTYKGNGFRSSGLKRRGRPMKAGPSRSVKRPRKSELYIGKLSNVVQFRRHWTSESESDADSYYTF